MEIRTATLRDLDMAAALEASCFPPAEAASKASLRARLETYPDCFWLLLHQGKLVSMVNGMATSQADLTDELYDQASLHQPDGDWQMIFGVDTDPAYRCQGCAGQLLRHVIQQAKLQGRKGLVLTCKEALLPYYAKFGFVNEGISASVHGNVQWYQMRLTF
ncbi:MAG: GNAT family N-acetyltransferase [Evtepia sp.]|uniref:GNAT family N-acetyltransferase n=1 Tax=Evtepia sp. TaxID=2773933 RepID=UPI002A75EEB7|nr:GNAT family N-acetyltransferase [Evtepia sp.]MDY3014935.1 GNAT family N-acetyltransferase [Evtepia sp.]